LPVWQPLAVVAAVKPLLAPKPALLLAPKPAPLLALLLALLPAPLLAPAPPRLLSLARVGDRPLLFAGSQINRG